MSAVFFTVLYTKSVKPMHWHIHGLTLLYPFYR